MTPSAASGDYERVHNAAIDADLANLAAAPTTAAQTAALAPIAKYVASYLPVIPVTTASEWFEYDSDHFVGWPTQANPYETGQPSGTNLGAGAGTDLVPLGVGGVPADRVAVTAAELDLAPSATSALTQFGDASLATATLLAVPADAAAEDVGAAEGRSRRLDIAPTTAVGILITVGFTVVFGVWPGPLFSFVHAAGLLF